MSITRQTIAPGTAGLALFGLALTVLYATRRSSALSIAAHLAFRATKSHGARDGAERTAPSSVLITYFVFLAAKSVFAAYLSFLTLTYAIPINTGCAIIAWGTTFAAASAFATYAIATERTFRHVPIANAVEANLARIAVVMVSTTRRLLANPATADLVGLA